MVDFLGKYADNYEEIIKIDETKLSKIYSAYNLQYNRNCILKVIIKENMKLGDYDFLLEKIKREEQLTKLCKSKHVIELYQKFESENSYIFEFEYCEGNLFEEIINKKGGLEGDKKFLRQIILDIAKALKTMHDKGIMHRDIKPNNIFLNHLDESQGQIVTKLGDFGCSIFIKDNTSDSIGTILYAAPEILQNLPYNEKCDLWSLGVTLHELYFGLLPYGPSANMNLNTILEFIYNENFIFMKSKIPSFDILLHRLLMREQDERMSFDEFFSVVFDKNFLTNEDAFLQSYPKYNDLYYKISKEENPVYPNLEIQESDDPIKQNQIYKEQIMTLVKGGHIPDIMNVPNGCINEKEEVFNNIIYYDENFEFKKAVHEDSDYFERITPGAFILCTNLESLKLITYEVINQKRKAHNTIFNLITTGRACETIMSFLNSNKPFDDCINKISIFCMNLGKWSYLKGKYTKIEGVYNRQSDIKNFIVKYSSKDIKAFPITKLITYYDYINKYKNRHEKISEFYGNLSVEEYKKNLDAMKELIQDDKNSLKKNPQVLLGGFMKFDIKQDLDFLNKLIIKEYTKETFYGDLNRWLMDSRMNSYDTIAYFTSRLMYSLNTYGKQNKMYFNKDKTQLRRGIKIPYSCLLPYERAIGKVILLSSFTSTSEKELTARTFSGRDKSKKQYETSKIFSVIYIITNNHHNNWVSNGINVQNETVVKSEKEILFQPFSFYLLKKLDIDIKNYTADIYLETIGKTEILEEKIQKGKSIVYNESKKIMQVKN